VTIATVRTLSVLIAILSFFALSACIFEPHPSKQPGSPQPNIEQVCSDRIALLQDVVTEAVGSTRENKAYSFLEKGSLPFLSKDCGVQVRLWLQGCSTTAAHRNECTAVDIDRSVHDFLVVRCLQANGVALPQEDPSRPPSSEALFRAMRRLSREQTSVASLCEALAFPTP